MKDIMNNIINEEISTFYNERLYELRLCEQSRINNLYNTEINENDQDNNNPNKRDEIITLIKNNQWEEQNPQEFYDSLKKSKHPLMLTDYSTSELSQMKLFKLKGYNIGFALKKFNGRYSEIVAVHNNEPSIKNIGDELMNAAIQNGGCYLDHFDGFLSKLYSDTGFVEYKREPYNPKYDPKGIFKSKYGEQDVIFRVHKSCGG